MTLYLNCDLYIKNGNFGLFCLLGHLCSTQTHILSLLQNPVPNVEDLKVGRFVAAKYQGAWSRAEVVDVKGVCIGRGGGE